MSRLIAATAHIPLAASRLQRGTDPTAHLPSSRDLSLVRAIRLPEVLHLTGLSRSTWYALLNPNEPSYDPNAPKPFKVGRSPQSPSLWWAWQVVAYLESKAAGHING